MYDASVEDLVCQGLKIGFPTKVRKTASTEQRALAEVSLRSEQPGLREDVSRALVRMLGREDRQKFGFSKAELVAKL